MDKPVVAKPEPQGRLDKQNQDLPIRHQVVQRPQLHDLAIHLRHRVAVVAAAEVVVVAVVAVPDQLEEEEVNLQHIFNTHIHEKIYLAGSSRLGYYWL